MTQQQPELLDLYRAGLKGAVDLMKASLENVERMQNQQLIAIRSALDAQMKSAAELGQAKTVDDLLAVQTRMAGAQVERMVGYWTSLYENQLTAIGQLQSQIQQAGQWFSEAQATTSHAAAKRRRETSPAR